MARVDDLRTGMALRCPLPAQAEHSPVGSS